MLCLPLHGILFHLFQKVIPNKILCHNYIGIGILGISFIHTHNDMVMYTMNKVETTCKVQKERTRRTTRKIKIRITATNW